MLKQVENTISRTLLIMQPQVRRGAHSREKWTGWDLNPRPLPCQDSDLPADLPAQRIARKLAGIKRYSRDGNAREAWGLDRKGFCAIQHGAMIPCGFDLERRGTPHRCYPP